MLSLEALLEDVVPHWVISSVIDRVLIMSAFNCAASLWDFIKTHAVDVSQVVARRLGSAVARVLLALGIASVVSANHGLTDVTIGVLAISHSRLDATLHGVYNLLPQLVYINFLGSCVHYHTLECSLEPLDVLSS